MAKRIYLPSKKYMEENNYDSIKMIPRCSLCGALLTVYATDTICECCKDDRRDDDDERYTYE